MKKKNSDRERKTGIEDILSHFAVGFFAHHTVDDILWDLAKNVISKLEFEDCVIYLVDKERNVLMQKAAYGPKNPKDRQIFEPIEIPLGKGIVGTVAQTGMPEIIKDTTKDPRYILDDEQRLSEITVPIKIKEEVIGIIDSEHHQKGFFKKWHLRALELIATLCAEKIASLPNGAAGDVDHYELFKDLKLTALDNRLNPHFLFNSLNAIQHFITLNDSENALKYLARFGKLVRRSISQASQDWTSLEEELGLIASYLELEKLRSEHNVNYSIDIGQPAGLRLMIPNLLIHPIVDNLFNLNKNFEIHEKSLRLESATENNKLFISLDFTCLLNAAAPEAPGAFAFFNYHQDRFLSARIDMLRKQLKDNFGLAVAEKIENVENARKAFQKIVISLPQNIDEEQRRQT